MQERKPKQGRGSKKKEKVDQTQGGKINPPENFAKQGNVKP